MRRIIIVVIALFSISYFSQSQGIGIGIFAGLSTPNDQINDIYNSQSSIGSMVRDGAKLGYHIGAKIRLPFSGNFKFVGGIALNRFAESEIEVQMTNGEKVVLATTQNIIPLSAGINFYPIKTAFLDIYASGELSYNYLSSSVDIKKGDVNIPFDKSPTDSRVGAGIGVGVDLDIKLFIINLEGKYQFVNIIGKKDNEESKGYFALSLGIYFGGSFLP